MSTKTERSYGRVIVLDHTLDCTCVPNEVAMCVCGKYEDLNHDVILPSLATNVGYELMWMLLSVLIKGSFLSSFSYTVLKCLTHL